VSIDRSKLRVRVSCTLINKTKQFVDLNIASRVTECNVNALKDTSSVTCNRPVADIAKM
jgi:hypothetical protein